jgi:hypothetical protein
MMNSVMGVTELGELDKLVRNIINEMVEGPALFRDRFYTANKNRGFRFLLLTESNQTCKYNKATHFLQRDQGTRDFID